MAAEVFHVFVLLIDSFLPKVGLRCVRQFRRTLVVLRKSSQIYQNLQQIFSTRSAESSTDVVNVDHMRHYIRIGSKQSRIRRAVKGNTGREELGSIVGRPAKYGSKYSPKKMKRASFHSIVSGVQKTNKRNGGNIVVMYTTVCLQLSIPDKILSIASSAYLAKGRT